jgi:hypothetical protein
MMKSRAAGCFINSSITPLRVSALMARSACSGPSLYLSPVALQPRADGQFHPSSAWSCVGGVSIVSGGEKRTVARTQSTSFSYLAQQRAARSPPKPQNRRQERSLNLRGRKDR